MARNFRTALTKDDVELILNSIPSGSTTYLKLKIAWLKFTAVTAAGLAMTSNGKIVDLNLLSAPSTFSAAHTTKSKCPIKLPVDTIAALDRVFNNLGDSETIEYMVFPWQFPMQQGVIGIPANTCYILAQVLMDQSVGRKELEEITAELPEHVKETLVWEKIVEARSSVVERKDWKEFKEILFNAE